MSIWYEYGMFICTSYICCVDDEIDNGYIYYFIQFVKEQDSQVWHKDISPIKVAHGFHDYLISQKKKKEKKYTAIVISTF